LQRAGADLTSLDQARGLIWVDSNPKDFPQNLPPSIEWVQLPSAGVESWLSAAMIDRVRTWTAMAGAYSGSVAEHALALLLAGVRAIPNFIEHKSWAKSELDGRIETLAGTTVAIVGCGGIGRALIPSLRALDAHVLAVTRSGRPVEGADDTLPASHTDAVWSRADHVVLAAPATPATRHLVGAAELRSMREHSWLVNVGRGTLIDTAALVTALDESQIAGAALDVTDPEPLPDGHPLWSHPRAIISPHVANPSTLLRRAFLRRVEANVVRFASGQSLLGVIDVEAGY
jgi:D-3-phosphoglycerate dehydrogenase